MYKSLFYLSFSIYTSLFKVHFVIYMPFSEIPLCIRRVIWVDLFWHVCTGLFPRSLLPYTNLFSRSILTCRSFSTRLFPYHRYRHTFLSKFPTTCAFLHDKIAKSEDWIYWLTVMLVLQTWTHVLIEIFDYDSISNHDLAGKIEMPLTETGGPVEFRLEGQNSQKSARCIVYNVKWL